MREHSPDTQTTAASEPNVTPMLDVLLVLIIIFMWIVMKSSGQIEAQLPEPCRIGCDGGTSIVLEVLPGPAYRLNQTPVHPDSLLDRLRQTYSGRPIKVLQIAGSREATYQQVITAMDLARSAGVTVVGLPTTNLPGTKN
jgi:biopolymer transport protein TolR